MNRNDKRDLMPQIQPFRAVRYNPQQVGDLANVTAPPFDSISPALQEELYARHPHNIVRLILGRIEPGDNGATNRYVRAAQQMSDWLASGVLLRDDEPAIYICEQAFDHDGGRAVRRGFFTRVRLEDYSTGAIVPHEHTMIGPREDRMRLMTACRANLSPIFGIYPDSGRFTAGLLDPAAHGEPLVEFVDDDGVGCRIWAATDAAWIGRLAGSLVDVPMYIADGHHRYETALAYRDKRLRETPDATGDEPFCHVLMFCVADSDPGLVILPFHRAVRGIDAARLASFAERAAEYFDVVARRPEELPAFDDDPVGAFSTPQTTFVYHARGSDTVFELRLKDAVRRKFADSTRDPLDVSILHTLVIESLLGLETKRASDRGDIVYARDACEPVSLVREGKYQAALFLRPTRVDQFHAAVEAGLRMPPKSTYFHPKPLSGVAINLL